VVDLLCLFDDEPFNKSGVPRIFQRLNDLSDFFIDALAGCFFLWIDADDFNL